MRYHSLVDTLGALSSTATALGVASCGILLGQERLDDKCSQAIGCREIVRRSRLNRLLFGISHGFGTLRHSRAMVGFCCWVVRLGMRESGARPGGAPSAPSTHRAALEQFAQSVCRAGGIETYSCENGGPPPPRAACTLRRAVEATGAPEEKRDKKASPSMSTPAVAPRRDAGVPSSDGDRSQCFAQATAAP